MVWSLTKNKDWRSLETEFPWVAEMRGVQQDPSHHAEGDVAIHTQMVLESLSGLADFHKLGEQSREILWASALLHDVEKRSTTVLESDGRITSRGHAKKGEFTSRKVLFRDVPAPFEIREKICALVRYHGLPLWVFDKADPGRSLREAALRIEMPFLAMLARADVLGRICTDQKDLIDRIELFEAYCQEQDCWSSYPAFANDLTRFVYFNKPGSSPDYVPYDDLKAAVTMLSGLPGMGKDTYIQNHCPDQPIVCLDDIRRKYKLKPNNSSATGWVVQEAKEQAKRYLRKGEPFIWNATNITRQMRLKWIDLFTMYKARVDLIYVEVPYKDWLRQNSYREHPVPTEVLERMLLKLEVPTPDEAHRVRYMV